MDFNHIQTLIDLLRANGVKKFSNQDISLEFASYGEPDLITDVGQKYVPTHAQPSSATIAPVATTSGTVVSAEMVGTVYLSANPQKPKFVEVGAKVRKGQTLCLIEAMKTYFEVKATVEGTIEKIYIQEKDMVDFGKPLFSIV